VLQASGEEAKAGLAFGVVQQVDRVLVVLPTRDLAEPRTPRDCGGCWPALPASAYGSMAPKPQSCVRWAPGSLGETFRDTSLAALL
jgi:hypothetical protein